MSLIQKVKNNIYFLKMSLKIALSIVCYILFTVYTVPIFNNVRAYTDERFAQRRTIIVSDTPVLAEIADKPSRREKGLSGRKELESGQGMFFVFNTIDFHGIWMKDMFISIDIIWFNEYGEIVDFVENVSPETYPTVFKPKVKSKYVLEVPAGFIEKEGVKLGDKIDLY